MKPLGEKESLELDNLRTDLLKKIKEEIKLVLLNWNLWEKDLKKYESATLLSIKSNVPFSKESNAIFKNNQKDEKHFNTLLKKRNQKTNNFLKNNIKDYEYIKIIPKILKSFRKLRSLEEKFNNTLNTAF